ncbi:hypothetical protein [Acetobacterium tundrae]|uniref:PepSY domain-containing protein n=1 Tax=Acetobacterium tundrae TaxID=132932 RepID=A0ABR6WLH0_9FIRM|nr:hypothetical protein [Acetobacterium tundrae]MBC3796977.1 hypothetical protein [Acetobacterium tundrae]
MKNFKSLSLVAVILLFGVVFLGYSSVSSLSNQGTISKETVFDFYNKVQFDQTKDQVDTELGILPTESAQLKNAFNYNEEDTGYGVSIILNENGLVTSKTLIYPTSKDIAFLTTKAVTQEQADKITDGMSYNEVKNLLGSEGTEINGTQIPFEDNKVSYIRVWINDDESMIRVVFGTDGTENNVMFYE